MPRQYTPGVERICQRCGRAFSVMASRAARGYGRYCDWTCRFGGSIPARLLARTNKNGPVPAHRSEYGQCWPWTGTMEANGYGRIIIRGTRWRASRLAWVVRSGLAIPDGIDVLHVCDNRACVRNDDAGVYVVRGVPLPRFGHLFLGVDADNRADAQAKGRVATGDRSGARLHRERMLRGEQHPRAKLTEMQVRTILDALRMQPAPSY